jgi:AraC-like DNA-binding protein
MAAMRDAQASSDRLKDAFGVPATPLFTAQTLSRREHVAVTQLQSDGPLGLTRPIPRDPTFLVSLNLLDLTHHELWEDGVAQRVQPLAAGQTTLYDLRRGPIGDLPSPLRSVCFHLPLAALNELAQEGSGAARVDELHYRGPGVGNDDPVTRHLALALLPSFDHPEEVCDVLLQHVLLAMCSRVVSTYCGVRAASRPRRGALAPWQLRRAEEALLANLGGTVSLAELARECGLSLSHFARAFRHTTGVPPHRWLLERRVDKAKSLLRSGLPLAQIAFSCGFNGQSHFTRVFTSVVGISPGAWRRHQ